MLRETQKTQVCLRERNNGMALTGESWAERRWSELERKSIWVKREGKKVNERAIRS